MNGEIVMKHSILRKNHRSYKVYGTLIILLLLSACSERSMIDLEEYVAKIKSRENPHVDPIPEIKHTLRSVIRNRCQMVHKCYLITGYPICFAVF